MVDAEFTTLLDDVLEAPSKDPELELVELKLDELKLVELELAEVDLLVDVSVCVSVYDPLTTTSMMWSGMR